MKTIHRFTFGMGDRFGHQGEAQLSAVLDARARGIDVCPTWNKSNREHSIIGSQPDDLRAEADAAVAALGYEGDYYVDADHIGLSTVDPFLAGSDFFTLDVADSIGKPAAAADVDAFVAAHGALIGRVAIPGIDEPLEIGEDAVRRAAGKFLLAAQEAGRIHRHIAAAKADDFVTEVSVDETDSPQSPVELLLILAMLARENVPVQTIAPKFTGRFNKGVDYVGDLAQFEREFDQDLCVLAYAVAEFGLPETLKLSVHSGSDKFSLYPIINQLIRKHDAGLHVKTAGTTWLEEVIGLAESGSNGLAVAKKIYAGAHAKFEDLTAPYASVIDINRANLPDPSAVEGWTSEEYVETLRHEPTCSAYNSDVRQLLHVGFKVAAHLGNEFTSALEANAGIVSRNVSHNLLVRHIVPIFG